MWRCGVRNRSRWRPDDMKLRILSNCRGEGRHLAIGEVAEVSTATANDLLALGLAEIAPEPEAMPAPPTGRPGRRPGVAFETASDEELAMPAGKVPTKRGRPQLTKEP